LVQRCIHSLKRSRRRDEDRKRVPLVDCFPDLELARDGHAADEPAAMEEKTAD
jgi:hypothetical protein